MSKSNYSFYPYPYFWYFLPVPVLSIPSNTPHSFTCIRIIPLPHVPGQTSPSHQLGEHYGAVMNLDFDYKKYLQTLHDEGMNMTRTFSGTYVENPQSFNI